jgi:hypothetical protein
VIAGIRHPPDRPGRKEGEAACEVVCSLLTFLPSPKARASGSTVSEERQDGPHGQVVHSLSDNQGRSAGPLSADNASQAQRLLLEAYM